MNVAARLCVIGSLLSFGALAAASVYGSGTSAPASVSQILKAVQASQSLQKLPTGLQPDLSNTSDVAQVPGNGAPTQYKCKAAGPNQDNIPAYAFGECVYGDPAGKKLMIVYGDSHGEMWSSAMATLAAKMGWRLENFNLPGCPAPDLNFISYQTNAANTQCTTFHKIAPLAIRAQHPNLVVVTSESTQDVAVGKSATPAQWQSGLLATFRQLKGVGARVVMIGDIPGWQNDNANCLAAHESSVQDCASVAAQALSPDLGAERTAALKSGAQYVSVTPWICAAKCEPVIAKYRVYLDEHHLTGAFVQYLSGALGQTLKLPAG